MKCSTNAVDQAQRNASDAKHEFEDVTRLLRSELARFDKSRIEDVKTALELYINGVIKRQTLVGLTNCACCFKTDQGTGGQALGRLSGRVAKYRQTERK